MGDYQRKSNRQWYLNRGKVLARVSCPGSEQEPTAITTPESKLVDELTGKEIKRSPKGTCPDCGDEIALVPIGATGSFAIRKHKASTGIYKRKILIDETTYQKLISRALRKTMEPDDLADEILAVRLNEMLASPESLN
jgi:hypothetical protein